MKTENENENRNCGCSLYKSKEEIIAACHAFCGEFGWDYFNVFYSECENFPCPQKTIISNYPKEYFEIYDRDRLSIIDPLAEYCRKNVSPIQWDQLYLMRGNMSADYQPYLNLNRAYNLNFGISIPIRTPNNGIGIFSLVRKQEITDDSPVSDSIFGAWIILGNVIDYLMLESSKKKNEAVRLTHREKECLRWLCEGKKSKEISRIIGITERTVSFHIAGITKKLGASNRQHAVAMAISNGHISF